MSDNPPLHAGTEIADDAVLSIESSAVTLTRSELHIAVWETPLLLLAKQWGISDVALGKACRRLQIPLPGRGYWAKKNSGPKAGLLSLPPPKSGTPETVTFNGHVARSVQQKRAVLAKQHTPSLFELADDTRKPHPLIRQIRDKAKSNKERDGRLYFGRSCIDLQVSTPALERALNLLDALFHQLSDEAIQVLVVPDERARTVALVDGEKIAFRMLEKRRQIYNPQAVKNQWASKFSLEPTGILRFEITHFLGYGIKHAWEDGKSRRLDHLLLEVAGSLKECATREKEWRQKRAADEARREKALLERREQQHQLQVLRQKRMQLIRHARNVERAKLIREMCKAVDESAGEIAMAWVAWARAEADAIDPLVCHIPWEQTE